MRITSPASRPLPPAPTIQERPSHSGCGGRADRESNTRSASESRAMRRPSTASARARTIMTSASRRIEELAAATAESERVEARAITPTRRDPQFHHLGGSGGSASSAKRSHCGALAPRACPRPRASPRSSAKASIAARSNESSKSSVRRRAAEGVSRSGTSPEGRNPPVSNASVSDPE